jgi:hypothetical protein
VIAPTPGNHSDSGTVQNLLARNNSAVSGQTTTPPLAAEDCSLEARLTGSPMTL